MEHCRKFTIEEMAEELCEVIPNGASASNVQWMLREWTHHLQHYHDSTVGLWATDRPDLVQDPEKVLFQLTSIEVKNG